MGHLPKPTRRLWEPKKKQKPQQGRKNDFSHVYNSTKHRKQRKIFLKKNPFCVDCQKIGILKAAVIFDHVIPLSQDSSYWATWSLENKQGLCNSHHNQKSGRESQAAQKRNKENE
jgi:5-methylcytosine-specific restriction protein A